jgi:hypothetical protein
MSHGASFCGLFTGSGGTNHHAIRQIAVEIDPSPWTAMSVMGRKTHQIGSASSAERSATQHAGPKLAT